MPDSKRIRTWTKRIVLVFAVGFGWYACSAPPNFSLDDVHSKLRKGMSPNEVETALGLSRGSIKLVEDPQSSIYSAEMTRHDWRNTCRSYDEYILGFDSNKRLTSLFWMGTDGDHHDEQSIELNSAN